MTSFLINMIWLCISFVLSITSVISDQYIETSHIKVFPAVNQSIAGVFQVSDLNDLNQPQYGFNASEARRLCSSLGVNIASKAQVQEALTRGLETCRFGWIDEHLAVVPRIKALSNCGKNRTGLVKWRTSVTQKFDVFCFNESDAATQLRDATTDSPLNSSDYSQQTQSPSKAATSTRTTQSTTSSSTPNDTDNEAVPARFVSSVQSFTGAKAILITSIFALLLTAIIILAYIKLSRALGSNIKQQQEYIQTEEWTCETNIKETKQAAQEDETIEVVDDAS
ncbi:lymphatic vessel endothelial hyaluronic acid receptor 1a isoform X2 [Etheostoma spectabile]|uniref:lymphatic vessel endothelial hyaluronic acid receptor 1a isoform X2 n=1 Tax=Etheostoma spectabile TaxID=54343 RepID=UPI0013AE9449|nr:lymphatic vessel endothelial hyaluronic acid receptor 1 isoform X2 [Etheostoma spectabile]